jgi:hypothetical protein
MPARPRIALLAGAALSLLIAAPPAVAQGPSADDPAATVTGLLDTLVAKDFAGVGRYVCAAKRAAVIDRFDLQTQFAELGEGVDVPALFDGITIATPDRSVTVTAVEGTTATVAVGGSITLDVTDDAARTFVTQLLVSQGSEVTDELLDQVTPLLVGQLETPQPLTGEVLMTLEGGSWLVCDDTFGAPAASPVPTGAVSQPIVSSGPAPSATPEPSLPPMDVEALATLSAAIPPDIASTCVPDSYWQVPDLGPDPGEIASLDCDVDGVAGPLYASYSLFDSPASADAFYDLQLQGAQNLGWTEGPGCPDGPGEGTAPNGRRYCYATFGDDANTRWTDASMGIVANVTHDDGDWAALEAFVASAGPVAP